MGERKLKERRGSERKKRMKKQERKGKKEMVNMTKHI